MNDKEINIAIAKVCGWYVREAQWLEEYAQPCWFKPGAEYPISRFTEGAPCCYAPDYANDLNAMHEAEMTLTDEQYSPVNIFVAAHEDTSFTGWLYRVMVRREIDPDFRCYSAPARKRAEAFLRTLNLWEEPK